MERDRKVIINFISILTTSQVHLQVGSHSLKEI